MFQDSVGSAVLLSLVDMTVVFLVLAFLMVVVYVTYFFVGRVKEPPRNSSDESCESDSLAKDPSSTLSANELEIVAIQAAALTAYQETRQDSGKQSEAQPDSLWKRTWFWTNTKPNSR